ncbi:MAG TPA: (2Fe-2S) ferredoxin domain-containing protein [Firmicutes bacterium]|nr:(2Fe-2S) ferredoxin domain-containing protein [Bacillota bacterium]
MDLTVCIGSSCHLKNSRAIIAGLEQLIQERQLTDRVTLRGSFCMEKCGCDGVSVKWNDTIYSLKPDELTAFVENEVLPRL